MSLYNMLCGNNPLFRLLHAILETAGPLAPIPRYRDTYTKITDSRGLASLPRIVIYTRTGGGNRPDYEDQNAALAAHPLYVRDHDDDFDCTFAHFEFSVPEVWADRVLKLHAFLERVPKGQTPSQKFKRSMAALEGKPADEDELPTDAEAQAFGELVGEMAVELNLIEDDAEGATDGREHED